jgi:hypothetical protein
VFRNEFPDTEWLQINPTSFAYLGRGSRTIAKNQASTAWTPGLLRDGFLCEYSKASMEEDFGMIAAELFANEPAFWLVVSKYQRLHSKVALAIAFYHELDPTFDEQYFRNLQTASVK